MVDPLVAVRAVHFASTVLFAGTVLFPQVIADDRARGSLPAFDRRLRWIVALALACVVASGAAWLWLFAAGLSGDDEGTLAAVLPKVLTETRFGWIWSVRAVLAAMLVPLVYRWSSGRPRRRAANWLLVVLALALLGSLAGVGHAGASLENWGLYFAADVLHLIAAAAWIGGLIPLALLLQAARVQADETSLSIAQRSTVRFSNYGIASVGTLLITGVASTWFLAGTIPALIGTPYGRLLLLKIGCFLAMVTIAAVNRRRLTPMLGTTKRSAALDRLLRNIALEIFLGLAVLTIVAALGTVPPGAHVQPSWPFSRRVDEAMLSQLSTGQMSAVLATAGGVLLVLAGLALRRYRWLIAVGFVIPMPLFPKLLDLTIEAVPTSYYASPTGYSAQAIARGQDLFAEHCSGCHGRWGHGVVPSGDDQKMPPDLTGDHVYAHRDGELYWSITQGIEDGMSGFGAVLDEEARWTLVDFIRANADGARLRALDGEVTTAAFPTPDFVVECPDGSARSVREMRGRSLHIIAGDRSSQQVIQRLSALRGRADALTIIAAMDGAPASGADVCTASNGDLVKAFSVFRGRAIESSDIMELLLDSEARLRAIWYPEADVDWTKPDVMREAVRRLDGPVTGRPSAGGHVH